MMTRDEARKRIDKILSFSKADACKVTVRSSALAQTRFARNEITTSGRVSDLAITVESTKGTRTGRITVNESSDDALRAAVRQAEDLAQYATPDPEFVEPLGPQKYPEIAGYDPDAAEAAQEQFLPGVREAVRGADARSLIAAGFYTRTATATAVASSGGAFGFDRRTSLSYSVTVRTPEGDGSGWGRAVGHRLADVDAPRAARVAIDKCVLSKAPRPLEPGLYTVVLEPAAVGDILSPLSLDLDARAAEEGRSVMTKKGGGTRIGEKMFSDSVTLYSNPTDPRAPGTPWGSELLPARKTTWIEKGVLKSLACTRYWAKKTETEPVPAPTSLVLEGQDHSLEDLIASTERGLLITRFWYIRYLNRQTVQLTGLTRDGVFMIEKGKVAHPVINFRWNESPIRLLANVEMMSRNEHTGAMIVPALKVRDFPFSSPSDAV